MIFINFQEWYPVVFLFLSVAYDSTELDMQWFEEQPVQINEDIDNFDLVPEFDLVETSFTRF